MFTPCSPTSTLALFIDPQFAEGYEAGYLSPETEEEWSIPQLVNWTYHFMQRELCFEEAWEDFGLHLPAWIVGCALGDLAGLAETERTLALVGIAHLSFLLPFLTLVLVLAPGQPAPSRFPAPDGAVCLPATGAQLPRARQELRGSATAGPGN